MEAFRTPQKMSNTNADALRLVLATLSESLTEASTSNVDANKKTWDRYAETWAPTADFVRAMPHGAAGQLELVGEEWSDAASLVHVLARFVMPHLRPSDAVLELGVGGARVARRVAPLCAGGSLLAVDISPKMLERARAALAEYAHVQCSLLATDPDALLRLAQPHSIDFAYWCALRSLSCPSIAHSFVRPSLTRFNSQSFDAFPHCDLHVIARYLRQMHKLLKKDGHLFFSTSDITTERGYTRFERQKQSTVAGFVWTSRDAVRKLIAKAGFEIVDESRESDGEDNVYFARDYLVLVRPRAE